MERREAFGKLLRTYRERALLSQDGLAERAGLSARTIRNLEAGRIRRPRAASVRLLGQALELQGSLRHAFEQAAHDHPAIASQEPAPTRPRAAITSESMLAGEALLFQLPPDVADFTGRGELVAELRKWLVASPVSEPPSPAVAVVAGKPGVGKTTLAVHLGHQLRQAFPDGQLWVQLGGARARPLPPGEVLGRFLRALGMDGALIPVGLEERAALYRTQLANRRVLVVLDDAAGEAQVRPLLPAGPGCGVLVTSRRRLAGLEGARLYDLEVFVPEQALELLTRIVGSARTAADPVAADRILTRCGRLPLAVRIAGARLRARPHWSVADLAERLGDERRRLDELAVGDLEVRASVALSYRGLDPLQRRAFCRLGLLEAPDFAGWVAAALLDIGVAPAEELLEILVDAQLLDVAGRDTSGQVRYRFHDLIRLFARERAAAEEQEADRQAALERALGSWLGLAEQAHRRMPTTTLAATGGTARRWPLPPQRGQALLADPLAWFESERPALVAATEQATALGLDELSWELAGSLTSFFDFRNHRDDWQRSHRVALAATRQAGNQRGTAYLLLGLGEFHAAGDQHEQTMACFKEALALLRQVGDTRGEAQALNALSLNLTLEGHHHAAGELAEQAMLIARQHHDRHIEANALFCAGRSHRDLGCFLDAERCFKAAQQRFHELGDRRREGQAWRALGMLYQQHGRVEQAATHLGRALVLFRELDDRLGEAFALESLAELQFVEGRPPQGEILERCLLVFCEVGDRLGELLTLRSLGQLHHTSNQLDQALACLERSLGLCRELGHPRTLALTLQTLGGVHASAGNHDAAQSAWDEARQILEASGMPAPDRFELR